MAEYCFSRYLQATLYTLLVDHRHKCVLKELKSFLNKFVDQFFLKNGSDTIGMTQENPRRVTMLALD